MLKIMYSMFVTKNENLLMKYVFINTKVNYFIDFISQEQLGNKHVITSSAFTS